MALKGTAHIGRTGQDRAWRSLFVVKRLAALVRNQWRVLVDAEHKLNFTVAELVLQKHERVAANVGRDIGMAGPSSLGIDEIIPTQFSSQYRQRNRRRLLGEYDGEMPLQHRKLNYRNGNRIRFSGKGEIRCACQSLLPKADGIEDSRPAIKDWKRRVRAVCGFRWGHFAFVGHAAGRDQIPYGIGRRTRVKPNQAVKDMD